MNLSLLSFIHQVLVWVLGRQLQASLELSILLILSPIWSPLSKGYVGLGRMK